MDSANLSKAQNALSSFESNLGRDDAVRHLSEGLDYLYEVVMDSGAEAVRAQAIGDRYVAVGLKYVKSVLASGSATEPELESAHHLMQELKEYEFGAADEIRQVASETVTQLFDKYYTGYSNQEKIKILERLIDERKRRT